MGESLTVATLLWQANSRSRSFSRRYDERWVERLYRGFSRHLTGPFRFVCFTDRPRVFAEPVEQVVQADLGRGGYGDCIRPYALGGPMILVGLDTLVTGNIDHLAAYCLEGKHLALPRDPYHPEVACNGVALVPVGHEDIARHHRGENDMEWVRRFPHRFIDDLWPGQVVSWKGSVEKRGIGDARIIYFHGERKPDQMPGNKIIQQHWI